MASAPITPIEGNYINQNTLDGQITLSITPHIALYGLLMGQDDIGDLVRLNYPIMARVIECESGWDNSARGKAGEIGLCQFMPKTWEWMSKLSGYYGDIYSEKDQLYLMAWAFKEGFANHWTCYRLLNK